MHPTDKLYAQLHTDLSLLQPGSQEHAMVDKYLQVGTLTAHFVAGLCACMPIRGVTVCVCVCN